MFSFFKKFFMDDTAFVRVARGATLGLGTATASGQVDAMPQGVGIALAVLAGMIGAGEKNPPTAEK